MVCTRLGVPKANTVTAYLLQQIKLLAHRDRHTLSPWNPAANRSVALEGQTKLPPHLTASAWCDEWWLLRLSLQCHNSNPG